LVYNGQTLQLTPNNDVDVQELSDSIESNIVINDEGSLLSYTTSMKSGQLNSLRSRTRADDDNNDDCEESGGCDYQVQSDLLIEY
jgi:hypothetical protein